MSISRRRALKAGAVAPLGLVFAEPPELRLTKGAEEQAATPALQQLQPIGDRVRPITIAEFQARIQKAQRLMTMAKPQFAALYIAPGSSQYYFSGIRWGGGERLMALTIPQKGDPFLVCAAFEDGRLRENLLWPIEVRTWQEDESPYALVAKGIADRGFRTGRIGIDETTRFSFFDGLHKVTPGYECASGDPITIGCRGQKDTHELELMQIACEATVEVYRAVFGSLKEGMTQSQVGSLIRQGFSRKGMSGGALVLFGPAAALPHGTREPRALKEGDVVLVDGGGSVEGYQSDVTRTTMLGQPSEKIRRAFDTIHHAQQVVLATTAKGKTTGSVDDAARKVITDAGFGSGYELFTHRVGHGIGLDGHEHPYLVRGSTTILAPGMTFSNEPGIYIPGEFGVRLEEVMVVEEEGPARLLTPNLSPSITNPFG